MTTGFFASAGTSFSMSADLFASASPIVPSLFAGPLLPIILDMTKPFHIRKPVTSADNTTITKILKGTIWIGGILFPFLDKTWQYMLGIPDHNH